MKIATLNIDWAKGKNNKITIENYLNKIEFDFLILTEAIELNLSKYKYVYKTVQLPENIEYEGINYSNLLNGKKAFRIILYSKEKATKIYKTTDEKTNLAIEFNSEFGKILFYCTIIGTQFNRKPYAEIELENTINDCKELYTSNQNLIIIGDLNTSFFENEKRYSINKTTTKRLQELFAELKLYNTTETIKQNIDHIIIPEKFKSYIKKADTFVEKNALSDHKGIYIELSK